MTNNEKLTSIIKKFEDDLQAYDFEEFSKSVARYCGVIALKKVEKKLGQKLLPLLSKTYTVIDDVIFSLDRKTLVKYPPEKIDLYYKIPDFVEAIADGAFQGNECIIELDIPTNVTHLGSRAFEGCDHLSKISWWGHKSAGSHVFADCPRLKNIFTDDVDNFWYYRCDNFGSPFINGADLFVNGELCEEIIVPNDIFEGTLRAFKGCRSIKHIRFDKNNPYIEKVLLDAVDKKLSVF